MMNELLFKVHLNCTHASYQCSDCGESFSIMNALIDHQQENCVNRIVECQLSGCSARVRWNDVLNHYLNEDHQQQILRTINQSFLCRVQNATENGKHVEILETLTNLKQIIESIIESLQYQVTETNELQFRAVESTELIERISTMVQAKDLLDEKLTEMLETMINKNQTTIGKLMTLTNSQYDEFIPILNEDSFILFAFDVPANSKVFSMDSLYKRKLRTSRFGYHMSFQLGMQNSDDEIYLSIDMNLLDSPYNNILKFPFVYDVYCTLVSQHAREYDIIKCTKTLLNPPSLSKDSDTKTEDNSINKFFPLQVLFEPKYMYCSEGKFFVRIYIDFLRKGYASLQENYQHY